MEWLTINSEDNVMAEARNLRNMSMVQTPLLGDENTPLHVNSSGGTGFEGATPRHVVAFTPNPLATPLHGGASDVSGTPRTDGQSVISGTPLRTPMRDNLSINAGDGYSAVGDTPRENRLRQSSAKRALKAGFMSLPKPENNFELEVPEDEEEEEGAGGAVLSEEDAAERDARFRRRHEEEQRKALARRSLAVQQGLPRPANVDVEQLLQSLNISDEPASDEVQRLVDAELVQLLLHDSVAHPVPGTSRPGGSQSTYDMPADGDVHDAKSLIQAELAASLGFPNANEEQIRQGLEALSRSEEVDDSASWAHIRQQLAFDADSGVWTEPTQLSLPQRLSGYTVLLNDSRDMMTKEANKAAKTEKKLVVTLQGYQVRSQALGKRITDAFDLLQKTHVELQSFSQLRVNESVAGPRRVGSLKEEVVKLERRERMLQERYAELDSERKDSESRVSALEERVMAEAEALNEAALAEMEE